MKPKQQTQLKQFLLFAKNLNWFSPFFTKCDIIKTRTSVYYTLSRDVDDAETKQASSEMSVDHNTLSLMKRVNVSQREWEREGWLYYTSQGYLNTASSC